MRAFMSDRGERAFPVPPVVTTGWSERTWEHWEAGYNQGNAVEEAKRILRESEAPDPNYPHMVFHSPIGDNYRRDWALADAIRDTLLPALDELIRKQERGRFIAPFVSFTHWNREGFIGPFEEAQDLHDFLVWAL